MQFIFIANTINNNMISGVDIEQRCLEHFQNLFRDGEDSTLTNNDFIRKIIPKQLMRVPNYEKVKKVVTHQNSGSV